MISVLMPSRMRWESMTRACLSLLTRAQNIDDVEILVACDPDDWQTQQCEITNTKIWTAPERYGYFGMHRYCDALAEMATGEWLVLFNDDALMRTKRWDVLVQARRPCLLWPKANCFSDHANTFSIWPKFWYDAIGYTAPTLHIDSYLQRLGELTGEMQKIPVEIYHDRFDVTGNPEHDDQTYAEGRKILGPEGMHGEFPWGSLNADADKILQAYKDRGLG